MARKAVAATLASVVLFTALLVADSTVMAAQDNLSSSALTARIEVRERVFAFTMAGELSMRVLAQVEAFLASAPAECESLPHYLATLSAADSLTGEDAGIRYSANSTVASAQAAPIGDNLTLVFPFSGGSPGALSLSETLSINQEGGGGSVDLARHELHFLNIPISPDIASELCAVVGGSLATALRQSCNSTLAGAAFDSALTSLVQVAESRGFDLAAGWAPAGAECSASYWFTLVDSGVRGPTGSFDWIVHGSGTTASA